MMWVSERIKRQIQKQQPSHWQQQAANSNSTCLHHNKIISHTYVYCGISNWTDSLHGSHTIACAVNSNMYTQYISKRHSKWMEKKSATASSQNSHNRERAKRACTFSYAKLKLWNSYKVAIYRTIANNTYAAYPESATASAAAVSCCCCSCALSFQFSLVAFYLLGSAREHLVFTLFVARFTYKTKRKKANKHEKTTSSLRPQPPPPPTPLLSATVGTISMFVCISSKK